ncbi:hypothetical protein [Salinarchaeum laminariae]|uniref:hypothetical protein n=1 Tax=Salinarchaeum laminariae TaxID=869888 RepID=UPI0020C12C81|nr:hypothetical protein [Salinarchaeum laminariae]
MRLLQNHAATILALVLALPVIAYTILTPTNILITLVLANGLLGIGICLDYYVL